MMLDRIGMAYPSSDSVAREMALRRCLRMRGDAATAEEEEDRAVDDM
jgi:hypothetical protein